MNFVDPRKGMNVSGISMVVREGVRGPSSNFPRPVAVSVKIDLTALVDCAPCVFDCRTSTIAAGHRTRRHAKTWLSGRRGRKGKK
jgi:hypothetical protein